MHLAPKLAAASRCQRRPVHPDARFRRAGVCNEGDCAAVHGPDLGRGVDSGKLQSLAGASGGGGNDTSRKHAFQPLPLSHPNSNGARPALNWQRWSESRIFESCSGVYTLESYLDRFEHGFIFL